MVCKNQIIIDEFNFRAISQESIPNLQNELQEVPLNITQIYYPHVRAPANFAHLDENSSRELAWSL